MNAVEVQSRQEGERHHGRTVIVEVNNKPVRVPAPKASGRQIKEAAIAQNVKIELDFVLTEELSHGGTRVVGDNDVVEVHERSRFLAVDVDDNS